VWLHKSEWFSILVSYVLRTVFNHFWSAPDVVSVCLSKKQIEVGCKTTWLKNMENFFFDHPAFVNDEITNF